MHIIITLLLALVSRVAGSDSAPVVDSNHQIAVATASGHPCAVPVPVVTVISGDTFPIGGECPDVFGQDWPLFTDHYDQIDIREIHITAGCGCHFLFNYNNDPDYDFVEIFLDWDSDSDSWGGQYSLSFTGHNMIRLSDIDCGSELEISAERVANLWLWSDLHADLHADGYEKVFGSDSDSD